jgi:hypothetical protein
MEYGNGMYVLWIHICEHVSYMLDRLHTIHSWITIIIPSSFHHHPVIIPSSSRVIPHHPSSSRIIPNHPGLIKFHPRVIFLSKYLYTYSYIYTWAFMQSRTITFKNQIQSSPHHHPITIPHHPASSLVVKVSRIIHNHFKSLIIVTLLNVIIYRVY